MHNLFKLAAFAVVAALAAAQSTVVLLSPALTTNSGPAGGSGASGIVDVTVDTTAKTILLRARLAGLSTAVTMAHFHGPADIGISAGPIAGATIDTTAWTTHGGNLITNVPDAALTSILAGRTYINVHTNAYGAGELAGPVAFDNTGVAHLASSQETTLVNSPRQGVGIVRVNDNIVTGSIISFGFPTAGVTAVHIHGPADIGANANRWCDILLTPSEGTQRDFTCPNALTDDNRADMLAGRYYFNVHTSTNAGGEIRGQIIFPSQLDSDKAYIATLAPPSTITNSNGNGTGMVVFYKGSSTRGVAAAAATGLSSAMTNSHIHGPSTAVMVQLPQVLPAYVYQPFSVTEAQAAALVAGTTDTNTAYFNVHTSNNAGGEIRGYLSLLPRPTPPASSAAGGAGMASSVLALALAALVVQLAAAWSA